MHKKKILWIAHESNKSGANLCLKEFMQIAAVEGFDQVLVLPHKGNMELVAKELGVKCRIVHYYSWVTNCDKSFIQSLSFKRILRNCWAVIQLSAILMKERANLVFTNTSVIHIGAWASLFTAKKHYWYVHEMGEEDFGIKMPWGKFSYWFMNFTSSKVLTNSNHLAEKYREKKSGFKIDVVRYPVFIDSCLTAAEWSESKPVRLLLLGQIAETKGHLLALDAVAILKKYGFDIELSFVGKCENSHFIESVLTKIDNLGIRDLVHIIPYTDRPSHEIASHNVLLMCSRCEAFGRVTVEAMKIGVPVVGSDSCGTKEIIEHNRTGYLFEQGNPIALADAIREVISNEILRTKIISDAKLSSEILTDKSQFMSLLTQEY